MSKFRDCGECTACCTWLIGDAFGYPFGCGQTCKFLEDNKCGVYKARPKTCRDYQCAWTQKLLPEEMRPDICGFLVSVEDYENGQYLRVLSTNESKLKEEDQQFLEDWGKKMNTPVIFQN